MTQGTGPRQPRQILEQTLRAVPEALKSFNRLCELGCDPDVLAFLCYWLMPRDPVTLRTSKRSRLNARALHTVVIHNRPLDSWDTAADGLGLEDLRRIADEAEQLWKKILRLRRSPLVRELIQRGEIPRSTDDLLSGLPGCGEPFSGLRELPELAKKWSGPRQRPDFTRLLTSLYEHILERTRSWHDSEVGNILNSLLPKPPKDLKQWRYDHELTCPGSGPNEPPRI